MAIKITDILFTLVSINGGIITIFKYPEYWPAGISLIIAGFLLLYFSSYTSSINENEEEIKKLKERIEIDEKLLNTLKDIIMLKKK